MKYTYEQIKLSMPKEKAKKDAWWVKLWVRPISYPLSYLALNMGISPNIISVIAIIDAIIASILMAINNQTCIIIGLILFNIFIVFDCMDGTMARTQKRNSYMGEFYDAMGGYAMCAFTLLGATVCAINTGRNVIITDMDQMLLIAGSLGCICDVFARLIYQKYTANEMIANSKIGKPVVRENDVFYTDNMPKFGLTYLRMVLDRQFGIGGLFPPLVALSYFWGFMDAIIILYSLYHILAFVAVMIMFCKKATAYDAQNIK